MCILFYQIKYKANEVHCMVKKTKGIFIDLGMNKGIEYDT
jgi:hypothetical protein